MATILVTGSQGQLGRTLQDAAARHPEHRFIFLSREDLSITDVAAIDAAFARYRPQYLVNAAAYTAVDRAEEEKETAFSINGKGVELLAAAAAQRGCRMVHLSTDYVFSGKGSTPWKEDDPVAPLNVYGASKLEGERRAREANGKAIIIRTSWVYSVHGKNFVKTMLRLMKEKASLSVVDDQLGSPTHAADLAAAIVHIIASGKWVPGIYHYSNSGSTSWYGFAKAIRQFTGAACILHPVPSAAFPTPAQRPSFSVMDTRKIVQTFGVDIPRWEESLRRCLQAMAGKF